MEGKPVEETRYTRGTGESHWVVGEDDKSGPLEVEAKESKAMILQDGKEVGKAHD